MLERVKWLAGTVLLTAVLLYLAAVIYLVSRETTMVFEADVPVAAATPARPFERVTIPESGEAGPPAWVLPAAADAATQPWVIFFHGNGSTIGSRLNLLHAERLRGLGLNVLAPEYLGFAGTRGTPSEAGLERDGRAAFDYLTIGRRVSPSRVVLFGWSLGSAVAVDLASHVGVRAMILEGAPASLVQIGEERYPYFPIKLLMRNPFNSIGKIGRVHAPLLFLHSPQDQVVPFGDGQRLFQAANAPKTFVEIQGGHVYAVERDPAFWDDVRRFLASLQLVAVP